MFLNIEWYRILFSAPETLAQDVLHRLDSHLILNLNYPVGFDPDDISGSKFLSFGFEQHYISFKMLREYAIYWYLFLILLNIVTILVDIKSKW